MKADYHYDGTWLKCSGLMPTCSSHSSKDSPSAISGTPSDCPSRSSMPYRPVCLYAACGLIDTRRPDDPTSWPAPSLERHYNDSACMQCDCLRSWAGRCLYHCCAMITLQGSLFTLLWRSLYLACLHSHLGYTVFSGSAAPIEQSSRRYWPLGIWAMHI